MHIPKTAGTSLRVMVENKLNQNSVFPNTNFLKTNDGYPPLREIVKYDANIKNAKFFLGHYPLRWLKSNYPKFAVITFLRDPYKRTVSHLRHIKLHHPDFNKSSLSEIFFHKNLKNQFTNLQTRYLLDYEKEDITETDLPLAIENASNCLFVGISENFDLELNKLGQLLSINFSPSDKLNTFEYNSQANIIHDDFIPSEELKEKIIESNLIDKELFNHFNKKSNSNN